MVPNLAVTNLVSIKLCLGELSPNTAIIQQEGRRTSSFLLCFVMGRDPVELAKRAKYQPPAMRVRGVCYTKKSPFRYNVVVQA